MYQIQFRLELRPRPSWGSLQRSPRPIAGFKGSTSRTREGKGGSGGRGAVPSTFLLIYTHHPRQNGSLPQNILCTTPHDRVMFLVFEANFRSAQFRRFTSNEGVGVK